jgi:predicted nucleic acid-binding protein
VWIPAGYVSAEINCMNGVDTNVLIYSVDRRDARKRAKARNLLKQLRSGSVPTLLLWQVAAEFLRWLGFWQDQGHISPSASPRYLRLFRHFFVLTMPTAQVLDRALDLSARYSLSYWDSMLLGACREANRGPRGMRFGPNAAARPGSIASSFQRHGDWVVAVESQAARRLS